MVATCNMPSGGIDYKYYQAGLLSFASICSLLLAPLDIIEKLYKNLTLNLLSIAYIDATLKPDQEGQK
jgi:hypothetical protein